MEALAAAQPQAAAKQEWMLEEDAKALLPAGVVRKPGSTARFLSYGSAGGSNRKAAQSRLVGAAFCKLDVLWRVAACEVALLASYPWESAL